jgi:hypothetical protein
MAEKKVLRNYLATGSTTQKPKENTKKKTLSDYLNDRATETSGKTTGGLRDYLGANVSTAVGNRISSRVNAWLEGHNSYVTDYQNRYAGRKYSYEDAFVNDSGRWLDSVSEQMDKYEAERQEILSYMDQYSSYLDADWVKSVQDTLAKGREAQLQIRSVARNDFDWWNSFNNEDLVQKYGSAEDAYKYYQRSDGYSKKYAGQTYDQLTETLKGLEDGEEKDWLGSYASQVDYDEKSKFDLEAGAREIEDLEAQKEALIREFEAMDVVTGTPEGNKLNNEFLRNMEEYDRLIAEKKAYIDAASKIQKLVSMTDAAAGSKDFGVKSQYVNNVEYGLFGKPEFTDNTYAYVNNPMVEDKRMGGGEISARDLIAFADSAYRWDTPTRNSDSSYERDALEYIKPEEVSIYNYYYATQGPEKAQEYLDLLIDTFKSRKDAETVKNVAEFSKKNKVLSPVLASVLSVGTSIGSGFEYIEDVIRYGGDKLFGDEDAKIDRNESAIVTNAVRNTVAEQVDWEIGNWDAFDFLYNTTMSGVDSLAASVFGGAGGAVLGLSAAAQGTNDALMRGMSSDQAFWNGLWSGVFEGLFETISIGQFNALKEIAPKDIKDIFKNLGKSMLVNASEETLTEIANIGYDTLVNGEFANYTLEELKNGAWKQALNQVIEAGASGALMGMGMSTLGTGLGYAGGVRQANAEALKQYGGKTDVLIQEGLGNDTGSASYKLAQKYQTQTQGKDGKEGKALTGHQIRKLLEANQDQVTVNDRKLIQQAAEKRLTELGQTEDVTKLAEIATRYATGQKVSKEEKSFLANSKYGSRVYNELLPKNIASGEYTTAWAEEIGTKQVNAVAYNIRKIIDAMTEDPATYKPLESRVGTESSFGVSKSGQATIQESGEAFDIKKAEVVAFTTDEATGKITDVTFKTEDGTEVQASGIDFADSDQSYLVEAVSKIENITPAAATAIIRDYDPSSGQSVGEYLNGIDEAYTYGYHGYSTEDMKAGNFATKLTDTQSMSAYRLGESAKKIGIESQETTYKKMRTAAEAKMSAEQRAAQQKARIEGKDVEVYFKDGKTVVKFDEHSGKYDPKRMAAVNTAKFLSKLGIGGKYYFFESYLSKTLKDENGDALRVYKDDNGNEVEAPNGIYTNDGIIWIDLNAGDYGQGTALFTMGHELTHFIKDKSEKQFKVLCDLVTEAFDKTDLSMHKRVLAKQKFLEDKRDKAVSYEEAYEEVVADAMSTMLTDGSFYEKIMEIKVKDKGLFNTIKRFFEKMIAKFTKAYEKLTPDQQDAQDIREMKDMFDRIQQAFAEALVEASENFRASEQVLAQAGIEVNAKTDSGSLQSVRDVLNDAERKKVAKALAGRFGVTVEEAREWLKAETSLASLILNPKYSAFLDYEADPNEVAIKQNSDYPQGTVDFSNICKKRREFTQVMNRILRNFPNHVFAATDLAKIRTIMGEEGMTLPCGICYVEDRRQLDTIVAQDFINSLKLYREGSKVRPDGKPFNANQLKGLQLTDGDSYVPSIYELVSLEGRNSLKAKNPNMEAAWVRFNNARGMQAVRLLTNEAEYKRQILKYTPKTVQTKNDYGGLRIYSFSDAEMFHLIDIVQVLTDCAAVGLKVQGYTKVNEYAKAVKDTGEKLNRSLIPLGDLGYHMENGKVVLDYDPVEGIDINSEDFFDSKDNPNVGNIVIGINPTQIRAAMVSDFIDYIIPFHTGQSAEVLGEKGIAAWVNYKDSQSEVDLATGKKSAHQINIYTEVFQAAENEGKPIRNKRDFVDKFLAVCKENGLKPRFAEFLNTDANGDYVYTEGYHKFLVDFKTFAQTEVGEYLPQMPVKPLFDNGYITGLLETYVKEQQVKDAEVAEQMPKVIERITNEIVKPAMDGAKHSDRDSTGKQLTKEQQEFFKDSVVRDENGNLLTVYHGTDADFTVFEANKDTTGEKYYFAASRTWVKNLFKEEKYHAPKNIMRVYLNIKNPLDLRSAPYVMTGNEWIDYFDSIGVPISKQFREFWSHPSKNKISFGSGKARGNITPWHIFMFDGISGGLRDTLASMGYDGLVIYDKVFGKADNTAYVAFHQNQIKLTSNKKPTTDPDTRYSVRSSKVDTDGMSAEAKKIISNLEIRARFSGISKGEYASYSAERIERELSNSSSATHMDYAKSYIAWVNPMDFLYATTTSDAGRAQIEKEAGELDLERLRKQTQPIHLTVDFETGKIVGHEGRHRMIALHKAGVEKVAVIFDAWNDDRHNTKPVDMMMIGGQEFDRYHGGLDFFVHDMLPLSKRYADAAKKLFSEVSGSVKFSERGGGTSNRSLLANAFEGITNGSDEYKLIQKYKGYIAELNSLEEKLSEFNRQIREIRFGKGKYDAEKLARLEGEAEKIRDAINKYDQYLLSLEASEPLRKVIERERKKEAKKTKEHVKEIQENKKVKAEQTELRHKIRKAVRDLDKILKRGNKQKNVKEDLQPVVTKALKAADILFTEHYGNYDMLRNGIEADMSDAEEALVATCARMLKDIDAMPTDGYENFMARQEAEKKLSAKMSKLKDVFARERKRLNNTTVSSILGDLADAYATLENSEQSYVQGAYNEAVHNFLKNLQSEVGGTVVQDMTKNQLENVYAAYQMVLTTVRKANQLFNQELKMSREQMANAVIREVTKAGGTHGLWTKAEIARSQAEWNNLKPVWVANRIGSESFAKLMQGLFEGQYNFAVDIEEARQFKLEMDKKYKPRSWDAEKLYEFESSTGKKFSLNLQQTMSLYAFSKREQAYSHLLNGGFVFEGNSTVIVDENGRKKTYIHNGATSYKLNEATLNGIINTLTPEQKAYADEMQKYLSETMGAKGNEVSMQLYGIKMFNEQFYFPLRSSGAYMERAKEAEMKKQQGQINLVNSGFTHAVKPQAKNPIILSGFMDVWAEHCNEMSMYHSMVLPMEDFRKVYNYSTVHDENFDSASVFQTIQDAYGNAATAYIDQLYRELNAGATVDPRETSFKARISNFKKAAVMLSGSVVVQQFSSIGRAFAIIDPRHFIGAKVNSGTNLSAVEEMKKYAPVAIIKEMGGFDTGTKGSAKSYIMAEKYGKGERLKGLLKDEQYRSDIMGYMPAKADELTWCAIWEAAKRETKAKHPNMDVKSEDFLKLAGARFSEVIEKTQVYDSVLARSANMRSKSGLMQMATAFMAEPTTAINLLEDAIRSGKARNIARAFGSVGVSILLNNALASIVYAMRDDDEDETFLEKYFQSFTSGLIDDINPMSYYPFLKDVWSLFQGYDVERADMSVIADVRDALKKAVAAMGKYDSDMDDEELAEFYKSVGSSLLSVLDAGCSMFGVPVKNVRRDAMGIINAWNTASKDLSNERDNSWLSFWDKVGSAVKDTIPVYAWTKDKAKADNLYEAIMAGDKAYLGRLKSTYKTDDAYNTAVRKALRENDPRIHEAAMARYEGKTEEYKRIFREIQKEGKFSFDDIMSAVNAEISKLTPDKESSDYTASGFVEAIILGDTKNAQAMREDIIATKVANGKTQEEAEKAFKTDVASGVGKAYSTGLLDAAGAKQMLLEYTDMDEEKAASRVAFWAFCEEHPKYKDVFTESHVGKYHEFAEPAEISVDVYAQYITGTKDLKTIKDEWGDVEVTLREQVLEVIDSLPLTWQQKDALYLAHGYSENTIWDVPW